MEWTLKDARRAEMVLHPSTQAAMAALEELRPLEPQRVLDVGCGSGLLTLAACQAWPQAQVLAADIHPQAVADATANFAAYGLEGRARALRVDGLAHAEIRKCSPYQLILCNLLAEILVRIAPDVRAALAPGGVAVLSGILPWKRAAVQQAYEGLGFEIIGEIEVEGWVALLVGMADES